MTDRMQGKNVVITGGNSGLGLAMARRCVDEGARVLVSGRNQEKLDAAMAGLGSGVLAVRADISNSSDLDALAAKAKDALGTVDALLVNAGMGLFAPLDGVDEDHYDRQFDVNVKGALFTVQKFLPLLGQGSSVVLTASVVHPKGLANTSVYSATKAAVRSMARTLAAELGPKGIRVNSVSPGYVATDFQAHMGLSAEQLQGFEESMRQATPTGRLSTPQDIAAAAAFLASPDAANISGVDLPVDGGWVSV